jgi:hypothetical protein
LGGLLAQQRIDHQPDRVRRHLQSRERHTHGRCVVRIRRVVSQTHLFPIRHSIAVAVGVIDAGTGRHLVTIRKTVAVVIAISIGRVVGIRAVGRFVLVGHAIVIGVSFEDDRAGVDRISWDD